MTSPTYIESGNRLRVYDSAVQAHDALPLGTYLVRFAPLDGFSLQRVQALAPGTDRVYGDREAKAHKVLHTYAASPRSLGVMLSGDKGQGKSLFLRMLARQALNAGIPVVRVTEDYDGLADFLDSLGECLVVFDEFEKVFPASPRPDTENRQNQFLPLFDGTSSCKRLYCVTVNNIRDASEYLVNRPGRFHYHLRFDYPDPQAVREYLMDQVPNVAENMLESAVQFSRAVPLNYDHLRAIAFELNQLTENSRTMTFADVVADLNIKAVESNNYRVTAIWADGSTASVVKRLDLFNEENEDHSFYLRDGMQSFWVSFRNEAVRRDPSGVLVVDIPQVDYENPDADTRGCPSRIELQLISQQSYSYAAF